VSVQALTPIIPIMGRAIGNFDMTTIAVSNRAVRLVTITEAAHRLKLSTKTIRRMLQRGDLRAHRLGRQLRIPEQELAALLAKTLG